MFVGHYPVSYTHLEVYYRLNTAANQSIERIFSHLEDRQLQRLVHCMDSIYKIINSVETGLTAVSYTHLDVYKRQEPDNPFCGIFFF